MENTKTPKVVVTMPCCNHENYVAESIESVLNQTYSNLELHCVDDGSSDKTLEVVRSYESDPRLVVHALPQNTKCIGSLKKQLEIIAASDAKYIASTSGDDYWKLDKLEKQIALLESHPEYKACFTWDELIFETEQSTFNLPLDYSQEANKSHYEWFHRLMFGNCLNACSAVMRREIWLELGGYNPMLRSLGDHYLWLLLSMKYPFYLIPEKLTIYRRHEKNHSNQDMGIIQGLTETLIYMREIFDSMSEDLFRKAYVNELIYTNWDSPYCFVAEKIMILLAYTRESMAQLAIELYYQHQFDQEFVELMEKRYDFSYEKLNGILRYSGLATFALNLPKPPELAPPPRKVDILLNDINSGSLTPEKLHIYPYGFFFAYLAAIVQLPEFLKYLELLKVTLAVAQKKVYQAKAGRNIVFMFGEDSQRSLAIRENAFYAPQRDRLYYCIVPLKENCFDYVPEARAALGEKGSRIESGAPVEYVEVYDSEKHYLGSLMDANVSPDLIVLVDCVTPEYDIERIIKMYALDVLFMHVAEENDSNVILHYFEKFPL